MCFVFYLVTYGHNLIPIFGVVKWAILHGKFLFQHSNWISGCLGNKLGFPDFNMQATKRGKIHHLKLLVTYGHLESNLRTFGFWTEMVNIAISWLLRI